MKCHISTNECRQIVLRGRFLEGVEFLLQDVQVVLCSAKSSQGGRLCLDDEPRLHYELDTPRSGG